MKLGIIDRITLLGILPPEGDLVTMRVLKKLKEDVGFTEDELKANNIQSADGKITWSNTGYEAEIQIGEKATDIITDSLKALNEQKKIREEMLPLYEKFCP